MATPLSGLAPGDAVTVRQRLPRRVPGGSGPDRFADAVGVLRAEGGELVLVRAGGGRVPVRPERVVAARAVPPAVRVRPPTDPAVLDRLAADHWTAAEDVAFGGWRLRAAGGFTRRANSALAVGPPPVPVPAALAAVASWYAGRGLPPRVSTADAALVAAVGPAGWAPELTNLVLTARTADVLARLPDGWSAGGPPIRTAPVPDAAWLAGYRDAATHPAGPGVLAVIAAPAGTTGLFATATAPGNPAGTAGPAGIGRVVVSDGWAGLSCVSVAPRLRRRGLGRLLAATLLDEALDAGAVRVYLQVEVDNAPAVALWTGLGFGFSHRTTYLRPVPGGGPAEQTTVGAAR